jgi:pilus assembly protein Flp/PilA
LSRIINFLKDESGAAAAEYALILAVVAGGIAVAATGLGTAITNAITAISALIVVP